LYFQDDRKIAYHNRTAGHGLKTGAGVFFHRCQDGENILNGGSLPGWQCDKKESIRKQKKQRTI